MELSKRAYAAIIAFVGLVLSSVVVWDIYVDWRLEGDPLLLTIAENAFPLSLAIGVIAGGYWLSQNRNLVYVRSVARWHLVGVVGIFALVGWVVAIQILQGKLKPRVIVIQTTIGGAVAGALVGYANARTEQTLDEVREERDRFEALFGNIPAEVADIELVEDEIRILNTNNAFVERFGSVESGALSTAVGHDEWTTDSIREAIATDDRMEAEVSVDLPDGRRYFQLRVAPYSEDSAYVIYTDVTEMQETQQRLERTVGQLERSNERLEEFAYIASHDLQEPLRTVSRYTELIDEEYGDQLDEDAREYLDTVVTGAERMSSMVNGLLDYSRVTTRGGEFEPVDTEAVVEEVTRDLEVLMEEHDGTVTVESLPTVEADRDQLWQVFQNLVKNALEHSEDDPIEITISGTQTEDGVEFVVEDDGPGIDPYLQDDIFDMFASGQNYQTQGKAKGIGLAVVERIIDRHDGEISVESEPGKGSRFCFTIPES